LLSYVALLVASKSLVSPLVLLSLPFLFYRRL
jgi:hypothetical protein